MTDNLLFILLVLVLSYFAIETISTTSYYFINNKKCNIVEKFEYNGRYTGKTILIIGSVHGNEPAGHYTLKKLKGKLDRKELSILNGKLILIPSPNPCGVQYNYREIPGGHDINRGFPYVKDGTSRTENNQKIVDYITESQPDLVIDFHEAYYFHKMNRDSWGSTIIINEPKYKKIALKCTSALNKTITNKKKHWSVISHFDQIPGSLRSYCNMMKQGYILIETTGQRNVQKIDRRVEENTIIINTILKQSKMIV